MLSILCDGLLSSLHVLPGDGGMLIEFRKSCFPSSL